MNPTSMFTAALAFHLAFSAHHLGSGPRSLTPSQPRSAAVFGALAATSQAAPPPAKRVSAPLPEGDGMAETKKLCVGCHSTESFTHQRHDRAGWNAVIDAMVAKGMDGSDEDYAKISAYLTANFGPSSPSTPATAPSPAAPATPPAAPLQ